MEKLVLILFGLFVGIFRSRKARHLQPTSHLPPVPNISDKPEQERREFDGFLDFELSKTHQTLFEAGKGFSNAFLTYILLLSITALLVFGKGVEGKVSVPLLQLQLDKDWAAGATLILSNIALFWFFSTFTYTQMLEYKLWGLLNKRYSILDNKTYREHVMTSEGKPSLWHILYPSLQLSVASSLLIFPKALGHLFILILALFVVVGIYGLPLYLAWQIGKVTFLWVTIFTLLSVLISQLTYIIFLPRNLKKLDYRQLDDTAMKLALQKINDSRNTLRR